MLSIASAFKADVARIEAFVELSESTFDLARVSISGLAGTHPIYASVINVHTKARAIPAGLSLACEGAYLSICAQYEQCVRDLVEATAIDAVTKKGQFALLPQKMREAHLQGCGMILQKLKRDKYKHLSASAIASALHGCVVASASPATLVVEAFSSNERNFKPDTVTEHFGKLGISDLWKLLGQQACLQSHFRTASPADATKFAMERLERIIDTRNGLSHRARGVASPSPSDVGECASFVVALSEALANVLDSYVASL